MYLSVSDLWRHVVSTPNDFQMFSGAATHHERRFLQALHSAPTLRFIADSLAKSARLPVSVASAYIDKSPQFTWPGAGAPAGSPKGSGEIADILVIVKRHHASGASSSWASLVQAKVTDSIAAYAGDPSSLQQIGLYGAWPPIEFATKDDRDALTAAGLVTTHTLNAAGAVAVAGAATPFQFLRVCKISPLAAGSTIADPAPKWSLALASGVAEPMAITELPLAGAGVALLSWLDSRGEMEPLDAGGNPEFVGLVKALLTVLQARQDAGRQGYVEGEFMREVDSALATPVATSSPLTFMATNVQWAKPVGMIGAREPRNRFKPVAAAPFALSAWLRRVGGALREFFRPSRPFVLLRIEFEAEPAGGGPIDAPQRSAYPGPDPRDF